MVDTRSERLGPHKPPGLYRVILEYNSSGRGTVTVVGEANVQRGVWNEDAVILIVSRCGQSEVESSTVPERIGIFRSRPNLPERRGAAYNEVDTGSRPACGTEELPAADILQRPEAVFFLGCDPLQRGIRIRSRGGEIEGVTGDRTFWLSLPRIG